jgi:hypothetical protein
MTLLISDGSHILTTQTIYIVIWIRHRYNKNQVQARFFLLRIVVCENSMHVNNLFKLLLNTLGQLFQDSLKYFVQFISTLYSKDTLKKLSPICKISPCKLFISFIKSKI